MQAGTRIVLCIEGPDGAGKSSLVRFLRRLCPERGRQITIVGRRGVFASPQVLPLTELLRSQRKVLSPPAEIHVRIAREYERARAAASAPPGIVVLDRFVLSVLALVRAYDRNADGLLGTFRELVGLSHLHATVYVECPFETAWERAQARNRELLRREPRNKSFLEKMAAAMEEEFRRGTLTGLQWPVDNSRSVGKAERELQGYLVPYLEDAPSS